MAQFWMGTRIFLIAVAMVGMAAVLLRYWREIRAAYKRIGGLGSQVIETDCGPQEYLRMGEGYPVLVVHGAMGGFDQGLWLAKGFDITRYQVISLSRFGYLRSPLPSGADLDRQADAFASLLDALGIRRAAVFAASAGSTAAIRFAARHPERVSALVLLCPDAPETRAGASPVLPPRWIFDTLLRSDFVYWLLVTFFARSVQNAVGLVPKGYPLTPELKAQLRTIQSGDLPVSQRIDGLIFETYTCAEAFQASTSPASPYPLSGIKIPTLVINAADDPISRRENVSALAAQMPNARQFVVPDGGHFLLGHREEAKSEIARFLHSYLVAQGNAG